MRNFSFRPSRQPGRFNNVKDKVDSLFEIIEIQLKANPTT